MGGEKEGGGKARSTPGTGRPAFSIFFASPLRAPAAASPPSPPRRHTHHTSFMSAAELLEARRQALESELARIEKAVSFVCVCVWFARRAPPTRCIAGLA